MPEYVNPRDLAARLSSQFNYQLHLKKMADIYGRTDRTTSSRMSSSRKQSVARSKSPTKNIYGCKSLERKFEFIAENQALFKRMQKIKESNSRQRKLDLEQSGM